MKKITIFLSFFLFAIAANAQQYTIKAELTGFEEHTKFYLKDNTTDQNVDSAILVNGKFTLKGKISSVKAFWLYTSTKEALYFTNLLMGADEVSIKADAKDFPWYVKIKGSPSQDVANILIQDTKAMWKARDSITKILMPLVFGKQSDSIRLITAPMSKQVAKLDSTREAITDQFIAKYYNSHAGLQQLYYKRAQYKKEQLEKMLQTVDPKFKNGLFGTRLTNYIKVGNTLKKGDEYHDFEAKDLSGKKYTLSSFKGKYILLDFTETYCGPCILATEDLKKLNDKYADQLQIVTFYVESNQKIVQQGLDRDQPKWPSIWDGKGSDSEIAMKYGINSYPTFVLIDPNGKIVSRFSGFGKDDDGKGSLEKEIERVLEKTK